MIYLLDRNQIISHSVNQSEIHLALSEIAKFISLSVVDNVFKMIPKPLNHIYIICLYNICEKLEF